MNRAARSQGEPMLDGRCAAMRRVYRQVDKVAPTELTVFLAGETGTGKELLARAVHDKSARRDGPYLAMNCGAIPGDLIESELFGHRRGAFTGAERAHTGFFQRAAGGTLFLDEVTGMSHDLQVKLLRVFESRRVRPVGGEKFVELDVRIVASTNRDPREAVENGVLRADLYYRLGEFPIRVPPLRERGEDVVHLAKVLLEERIAATGIRKALSDEAVAVLRRHDWPGNVRELKNVITRAHVLAEERIVPDDLPSELRDGRASPGEGFYIRPGESLAGVERKLIVATLAHFDGDKPAAAKTLGISLKTLYNRLKKYRDE